MTQTPQVVFQSPRLAEAVRRALEKPPQTYGVGSFSRPEETMPSGGASPTGGFFVITNASTEEDGPRITLTDTTGALGEDYCGVFVSGIDTVLVDKPVIPITHSGWVHLDAAYTPATEDADAAWTITFGVSTEIPAFTSTHYTALIGYVEYTAPHIASIRQIHLAGTIYNNRYA